MASFIQKVTDTFEYIDRNGDPRVREWFLMQSPALALTILVSYLLFIYIIGPNMMKSRPPLNIDNIVVIYNGFQVLYSAYLLKEACRNLWFTDSYNFFCIDINYSSPLGDEVFFVLRKKQAQISFLHVYHHSMVFSIGWYVTKYYPGGQVAFFGTINAFVHMTMYTHYLITSLHLVDKKALWWKKYITLLQLVQFIVTGAHAIIGLSCNSNFPKYLIALGIVQDVFMLVLFWDFYKKTYMSSNNANIDNNSNVKTSNKKIISDKKIN